MTVESFATKSGGDAEPASDAPTRTRARRNSFIIFVDRIFTTFIEPLFTNVFDAIAPIAAIPCLYRAGNAD
jgi:hypothetical protein